MTNFPELFSEYQLNTTLHLKNRIVMAPMTRAKSESDFTPTAAMAKYYAARAAAGLIVTEGTIISPDARGHDNVPGMFNAQQAAGWQRVTDAVHQQNGIIFSQLWHVGRVSHPIFLNGKLPISASATAMTGKIPRSQNLEFGSARAATTDDINRTIQDYRDAAERAISAGFDGIEIHGANGYLLDQFLHHHTNLRDDEYGGSPENMTRLALQVVAACSDAVGAENIGIRLSPGAYLNQIIGDVRDGEVFQYLLNQLSSMDIAYVHTGSFDHNAVFAELDGMTMSQFMRRHYHGTLISAGQYDAEKADGCIRDGQFDLAAFGRPFIANPDLVDRLKNGLPLTAYDAKMLNTLD